MDLNRPIGLRTPGRHFDESRLRARHMISAEHISYAGPIERDDALLSLLPPELRALLGEVNGFVAFGGGLHVRGACDEPGWHSLRSIWQGHLSLQRTYGRLRPDDIPFAQDCMGDQFVLREGEVYRLTLETAFFDNLQLSLGDFLAVAEKDPLEILQMHPLVQLQKGGGLLRPGQLINAYPPFSTEQAAEGVSFRAVAADDQIAYELEYFTKVNNLKDGETFTIHRLP